MGMDDSTLSSVISELPDKCIVLVEDIDAAFHQGIRRDIVDPEKQNGKSPEEDDKHRGEKENSDSISTRITLSGLLNALDGIGAQEGRILFATTNDYKALDPALCRPGRLDLHIEFKLASKYQCRELFRRFYLPSSADNDKDDEKTLDDADEKDSGYSSHTSSQPPTPASSTAPPSTSSSSAACDSGALAAYIGVAHSARAPKLSRRKAAELADQFAALIPDRSFSMATLQGYLMTCKVCPYDAVEQLPAWVERKMREKKAGARSDGPAQSTGARVVECKKEEPGSGGEAADAAATTTASTVKDEEAGAGAGAPSNGESERPAAA